MKKFSAKSAIARQLTQTFFFFFILYKNTFYQNLLFDRSIPFSSFSITFIKKFALSLIHTFFPRLERGGGEKERITKPGASAEILIKSFKVARASNFSRIKEQNGEFQKRRL